MSLLERKIEIVRERGGGDSQGNILGDIGIKETRNKAPVKGNTLSLQLVKQVPDALSVAMETVSGHQLVV